MSCSFGFDSPIQVDSHKLITLHDPRAYILKLPKPKQTDPLWVTATEALLRPAEHGGPWIMFARIGLMQAIHGKPGRPERDPAKDKIEFRNRRKADPWR